MKTEEYTVTGKVTEIGEVNQINDTFKVGRIVISTEGEYSQELPLQFINDRTNLINKLTLNERATVSFNVKGQRSRAGQLFVNHNAWKVHSKADGPVKNEFEEFLDTEEGNGIETQAETSPAPAPDTEDPVSVSPLNDQHKASTEEDIIPEDQLDF